ncbi:Pfam:DUF1994 [Geosmithia morbida]|uniref:Pfam:DUF1994 n=1 Tax=Geosmithia morbida TaxID=1094350 RepID=A0A9P5D931_9HYPO|nr:Pfam:DUF1994 [Geosmithia morbida]KAF4126094.1 Pfam:DUF1994 [Geosmithia morbida]
MKSAIAILLSSAAAVVAYPPGIPSESEARSLLSGLTVREPEDDGSYDRDLFPHWETVEGTCSAREYVLRRDGDDVQVGSDCYPTAGTWTSVYDGVTESVPSKISIDHMVPLKNAWISGASEWTTSEREKLANDVDAPQLWAVTTSINSKKSDRSPDSWKPPLTSIHCDYAASWIKVKSKYDLIVSSAEQAALEEMLGKC